MFNKCIMKKEELKAIYERLLDLQGQLVYAKMTNDKRVRDKRIRDARKAISDYAHYLPNEVKVYLDKKINFNAMSFKYAEEDIKWCIKAIEDWINNCPKEE